MSEQKRIQKGGENMDQLYTVSEMMDFLRVKRTTLYKLCKQGILPYFELGGQRRFVGSEVRKALKELRKRQAHANLRPSDQLVRNDTLSDVCTKLDHVNTNSNNNLEQLKKESDNKSDSTND